MGALGELEGSVRGKGGEPGLDTIKNNSPRSHRAGPYATRPGWTPGAPRSTWVDVPGRTWLKSVEACERGEWTLVLWRRNAVDLETGEVAESSLLRAPFPCGSWRCRRCSRWRGAVDWARARSGLMRRSAWLYLVLTFDPSKHADAWEAFRAGGAAWDKGLRRSIERGLERVLDELRDRGEPIPSGATRENGTLAPVVYLQTWESTARGWPHANVVLSHPLLERWLEEPELGRSRKDEPGVLEGAGLVERRTRSSSGAERRALCPARGWKAWLEREAERAGFGRISWAELLAPRSLGSMAGYLVKLARELTASGAKKGDQTPLSAPRGFRRIRASVGMLPPAPAGSGEFSGMLSPTPWNELDPGVRLTSSQRRAAGSPRALARVGDLEAAPWLLELARRARDGDPDRRERWSTWLEELAREDGNAWESSSLEGGGEQDSRHGATPFPRRDRIGRPQDARGRNPEASSALARRPRDDGPGLAPRGKPQGEFDASGRTDRELLELLELERLAAQWRIGRERELERLRRLERDRGRELELPLEHGLAWD